MPVEGLRVKFWMCLHAPTGSRRPLLSIHGSHRECQPSRHTFLHLLKAGSLFTLSGFDVTRCNQNFGLTDTSLTIRFSDSTTVVELNKPVSPIPQERLRFHAHDSMYGLAYINTHLPDILQGLTPVKSIVCDVPQGKGTCYDYALIILLEGFQGDPRVVVATINPKIVGDWSLKNWEHSSTYIAEEIRQG
ncbi:uncharacterized protein LOC106427992 [Brassica napus]|uniref:uncharacterized protein LOC106427992 n=1 Tax=Brassica napus TaxID=3708 RepID=UPI002078A875|nr:uncharacterized protein LOC106427992 [Brassica napus]XP_048604260.1 uncharacterized protein LOC106427992 [Brassica napus]